MNKKQYCKENPVIAVYADSAFTGIEIHGLDYNCGEVFAYCVAINPNGNTYHKCKLSKNNETFRVNGRRYNLKNFLRI